MLKSDGVLKWLDAYDVQKYPASVYVELVVEQRPYPGRIKILGAWKTGCLRAGGQGREYVDKNGIVYSFTGRWNPKSPIGYLTWIEISENEKEIKEKIQKDFSKEKPEIVAELGSREGFGFIWALFVLHCFYPETYPLFDQHVYRAYRYIDSSGRECLLTPRLDWSDYVTYRNFFCSQVEATALPYWEVDRALWAFGKHKKQFAKDTALARLQVRDCSSQVFAAKHTEIPVYSLQEEWVHSTTFGGKAKSFWWKIDDDGSLFITRNFKTTSGVVKKSVKFISREEIERLNKYMAINQWVSLSNNVEKLKNGKEKEGIGRFLYEHLKWNTTDCQLAGHLGVIFSLSGVWQFNGKERWIQFKQLNENWNNLIRDCYYQLIAADDA